MFNTLISSNLKSKLKMHLITNPLNEIIKLMLLKNNLSVLSCTQDMESSIASFITDFQKPTK